MLNLKLVFFAALERMKILTLSAMHRLQHTSPELILYTGMAYTLLCLTLTGEGGFFSGDSAIKFLLTRQFASGVLHPDLRLPADELTRSLWKMGFYPFSEPFVYALGGKYFINVPPFFSAITALPYATLGRRGLYVVPLLSLWLTWMVFVRTARRVSIDEKSISIALFALIFASPLTLYGTLYWEHTIGVLLAFCGLSLLATATPSRAFWMSLAAGGLLGCSIWFRSEMYVLNALVLGIAGVAYLRGSRAVQLIPLAVGMLFGVAVLLVFNVHVYGVITGLHAVQVLGQMETSRAENAIRVYGSIVPLLFLFFPVMLPIVWLASRATNRRANSSASSAVWSVGWFSMLAIALFPIGVALVAPSMSTGGDGGRQWGPRFLLILVPLSSMLFAVKLSEIAAWAEGPRRRAEFFVAGAILVGLVLNSMAAPLRVAWSSLPVSALLAKVREPSLYERLQSDRGDIVVFADWWGPQALIGIETSKKVFLATDTAALARLGAILLDRGITSFHYVAYKPTSFDLPLANGRLHVIAGRGTPLALSEARLER